MRTTQSTWIPNPLVNNIVWFLASLGLAFFIWVSSSTQSDPIIERGYTQVPILVELDEGMLLIEQATRYAQVTVRSSQSIINILSREDIIVRADLRGLPAGTHTIELQTDISRRAIADTQPRQITVTIEEMQSQSVPVVAFIADTNEPPTNFTRTEPQFNIQTVSVSGASSRVQQVVAARAVLDLSAQRETYTGDIRLVPVDADGRTVNDVILDPQMVQTVVEIRRRDDLRELAIAPDLDTQTLTPGYVIISVSYDPQTVFVIGSPQNLANLPDTLRTQLIDLSGQTADFEVQVPLVLPDDVALSVLGNPLVTVLVNIDAQTTTRQFDNVTVDIIGVAEGLTPRLIPDKVTALVTGAQTILDTMTATDIRIIVDMNGKGAGTYDTVPQIASGRSDILAQDISILPTNLTVILSSDAEATPTAIPEITPENTSMPTAENTATPSP
ncbi:MAG: CdaR family protein [bacterium]|nr:CdaR family protein [bacterium]